MNRTQKWMIGGLAALYLLSGSAAAGPRFALTTAAEAADLTEAAELVSDIRTTQYYTDAPVAEADIETILLAGINAPSAMNGQPWHFSVVTDASVLEEIAGGMSFGQKPAAAQGENLPEGQDIPQMPGNAEMPGDSSGFPSDGFPSDGFPSNGFPSGEFPSESGMMPPAASGTTKAGLTDVPLAIVISCKEGSELEAGIACQNMSVAAQLLGYGTKIVTSPTIALNGERQEEFRSMLGIPDGQKAVAVLLIGEEDTSVDTTADSYTGATERNPMNELVSFVTP